MRKAFSHLTLLFLIGCYSAPKIDGFDQQQWFNSLTECNDYRMLISDSIFKGSQSPLLTLSQNELQELLGKPDQHQLFNRNQKFFYYSLNCDKTYQLAVRFDALGRVKEVNIEKN